MFVMVLPWVTLLNVRELRGLVCRTLNWASGTSGRAGGVRKTYIPHPPKKKEFTHYFCLVEFQELSKKVE